MRNYQIIASDLDGTLFNSRAQISEENQRAIHALTACGVQFVPCTGRTFCDLPPILREHPDIRYYICSNGALLYDKQTDTRILNAISKELAAKVFAILDDYEVHISARFRGCCYVDALQNSDESFAYHQVFSSHIGVIKQYAVAVPDFAEWCKTLDHVEMFFLSFHDDRELEACKERLSKLDDLLLADPAAHCLELFSTAAGKGVALYALADLLGIDRLDTIGVGDSGNDIGMVEAAGLGLAVENASDALRAVCDEVICSNEAHAIDDIQRRYFTKTV